MYPADEALALARGVSPRSEHTAHEELVHAVTHGMGFIAAAVGLIVLLVAAGSRGTLSDVIGVCTFGVTLLVLYGASTLYHGLPQSRSKDVMRKLDHIAIYLLIAGTYTPFLLIEPPGLKSDVFLAVIWGLAGFGIILELARKSSTRRTSVVIYLGMGWLAVFALEPLFYALEFTGLVLLRPWRSQLLAGCHLLRLEPAAVQPRHLAWLRTLRKRVPLRVGPGLCDFLELERVTGRASEHVVRLHGQLGRDGRFDELSQEFGELLRYLDVGKVADPLEDMELATRNGIVSRVGVLDRNDRIGVSPDDERWNLGGEM